MVVKQKGFFSPRGWTWSDNQNKMACVFPAKFYRHVIIADQSIIIYDNDRSPLG